MTSTQPTTSAAGGVASRSESLTSSQGKTTIADTVVSKIAGIAAHEVNGVYALGGGASRAVGALRERFPGGSVNHAQGVSVEVGETQAAVDIDIVTEYGVSITDLAAGLRRNVMAAIERMTGLEVTEVNITVHDVHFAEDDRSDDQPAPARVQ
ncbi:UNVERIFIED_ORG: putative alkaline shock family protein YloU [Mycolicibacterium obuense]